MKISLTKKMLLFFITVFLFTSCKTSKSEVNKVQFIKSDVDNFYYALNLASKDTLNAKVIFKEHYFDKGSKGLDFFYKYKIKDLDKFTKKVIYYQDFYKSIKVDIENLTDLNTEIYKNYNNFKLIYPKANFPDVYFVVGNFYSNGTASKDGIILGMELLSKTPKTNISSLDNYLIKYQMERSHIPITVSHEIVHFNQNKMKNENTLLKYAIREGSAEFIGELICGKTDGDYSAYKGREKIIWSDFVLDMNKDVYKEWHLENEPKRPKNGLYWAGYMICKSYFNQIKDKEKVVAAILNCKDYQKLYKESKVEDFINENF